MTTVYEVYYQEVDYQDSLGFFDDPTTAIKLRDAVNEYEAARGMPEMCKVIPHTVHGRHLQYFTASITYMFLTGETFTDHIRPTMMDGTTMLHDVQAMVERNTVVGRLTVYGHNEALAQERMRMMLEDLQDGGYTDRILARLREQYSEE